MANSNRFPSIKKGTTFNGRDIKFFNGTGSTKTPMPLDGIQVIMDFKEVGNKSNSTVFSFKTSDNSITNTGNGIVRMMPRLMNLPAATYETTLTLKFANATIKTYGDPIIWKIE